MEFSALKHIWAEKMTWFPVFWWFNFDPYPLVAPLQLFLFQRKRPQPSEFCAGTIPDTGEILRLALTIRDSPVQTQHPPLQPNPTPPTCGLLQDYFKDFRADLEPEFYGTSHISWAKLQVVVHASIYRGSILGTMPGGRASICCPQAAPNQPRSP